MNCKNRIPIYPITAQRSVVGFFLTHEKEIAGMASPISVLVRIASRNPDRDGVTSAGWVFYPAIEFYQKDCSRGTMPNYTSESGSRTCDGHSTR